MEMVNTFPIALYNHYKCITTAINIHTKLDILTCAPRNPKFTSHLWNCQRPYIRCKCSQNTKIGCKGNMLWFDHSIWFMINNLPKFLCNNMYPSLPSKYRAFLTLMKLECRKLRSKSRDHFLSGSQTCGNSFFRICHGCFSEVIIQILRVQICHGCLSEVIIQILRGTRSSQSRTPFQAYFILN